MLAGCGTAPELADTPQPPSEPPAAASPTASPAPSPSPPTPTGIPALDSPSVVAAELIAAEEAIRDPATDPASLPVLGRIQQSAYRAAAANAQNKAAVLGAAPPALKATVEGNIRAGEQLRRLTRPQPELPDWTIVEPPPPDELRGYYGAAEAEFGVPWAYLAAIHLVETRMGRIRGNSPAGARGPMQFIPSTWDAYGEGDIDDPLDAIRAAGRYLKAAGAPADMGRALFAYNHSDLYVEAVSIYAQEMLADERAFLGYYHWQVYYRHVDGETLLEAGYSGS